MAVKHVAIDGKDHLDLRGHPAFKVVRRYSNEDFLCPNCGTKAKSLRQGGWGRCQHCWEWFNNRPDAIAEELAWMMVRAWRVGRANAISDFLDLMAGLYYDATHCANRYCQDEFGAAVIPYVDSRDRRTGWCVSCEVEARNDPDNRWAEWL